MEGGTVSDAITRGQLQWTEARTRREIADRQAEEYGRCLLWALGKFGPGWTPSHRHFLVEKEEEERDDARVQKGSADQDVEGRSSP